MTKAWTLAKKTAWEGGRTQCEVAGCERGAVDAHHVFIRSNAKFSKWVDSKYNLQMVCRECHENGEADSTESARWFWGVTYTKDAGFIEWVLTAPEKIKTHNNRYKLLCKWLIE